MLNWTKAGLAVSVIALMASPAMGQTLSDIADRSDTGGSLSQPLDSADQQTAPSSFSALSKRLMPAVVNISTSQTIATGDLPTFPDGSPLERFNEFFGRDDDGFQRQGSLGSGFVISADGLIVTNNHVIMGADEIEVIFHDERVLDAQLIGTDEDTDLAILRVRSQTPLAFVEFADSDLAEVGDWVMAIGNPFGFGGSVSAGIISARNRNIQAGRYDDFIQTDAAINRGNSGGPLFNLSGQVVGVNTAIISPTGGSVGIGFSIPANLARRVTDQLVEFGKARRGWLGVNVQDVDRDIARAYGVSGDEGVIVTNIDEDGPAAASDIEVGDLILTFDGRTVDDVRSLTRIVADTTIGKVVEITLVRDGGRRTADVTLGELDLGIEDEAPEAPPLTSLNDNEIGVEFAEIDDEARRRFGIPKNIEGVLIQSVSPRGPSFGKLIKGDVITEIGFETVASIDEASDALSDAKDAGGDGPLLLRLNRRGQVAFVSVDIAAD